MVFDFDGLAKGSRIERTLVPTSPWAAFKYGPSRSMTCAGVHCPGSGDGRVAVHIPPMHRSITKPLIIEWQAENNLTVHRGGTSCPTGNGAFR